MCLGLHDNTEGLMFRYAEKSHGRWSGNMGSLVAVVASQGFERELLIPRGLTPFPT